MANIPRDFHFVRIIFTKPQMDNQPRSKSASPVRKPRPHEPKNHVFAVRYGREEDDFYRVLDYFENIKAARVFAINWCRESEQTYGSFVRKGKWYRWESDEFWVDISEKPIFQTDVQRQVFEQYQNLGCDHEDTHTIRADGVPFCMQCSEKVKCKGCGNDAFVVAEELWCQTCKLSTPQ